MSDTWNPPVAVTCPYCGKTVNTSGVPGGRVVMNGHQPLGQPPKTLPLCKGSGEEITDAHS